MKIKIIFIRLSIIISILLIWQILGTINNRFYFFMGNPCEVIKEFYTLVVHNSLFKHFLVTGFEALIGIILGTSIGSLIGLSLWFSETTSKSLKPFIIALSNIPVLAIAPIMIIWFGVGLGMKIALAMFSTVFISLNLSYRGAINISQEYISVLNGFKAKNVTIFFKLIVPGSFENVFNSMRLNIGLGLLGAFIGEFISSDVGLGYLIMRASGLYNSPRVFAASIGIIILALIFDYLGILIETNKNKILQLISVPRVVRLYKKK